MKCQEQTVCLAVSSQVYPPLKMSPSAFYATRWEAPAVPLLTVSVSHFAFVVAAAAVYRCYLSVLPPLRHV